MPLKTIVVHVDASEATLARLALALALAERHGALLRGVHARGSIEFLSVYGEAAIGLIEAQDRWASEQAARSQELFHRTVANASIPTEWRQSSGDTVEVTARHARNGDLLIAGQNPEAPALIDRLLLAAGRPILVVPLSGGKPQFARVLVAWDGGREAARAVNDALPLLERAEQVTVLAVREPESDLGAHGETPCADICHHLARHGVKAKAAEARAEPGDAGNVLLTQAEDLGSDLIVMGAYGHSRLREIVLGGVTRMVLRHMPVPVLLSH